MVRCAVVVGIGIGIGIGAAIFAVRHDPDPVLQGPPPPVPEAKLPPGDEQRGIWAIAQAIGPDRGYDPTPRWGENIPPHSLRATRGGFRPNGAADHSPGREPRAVAACRPTCPPPC
ncbi:MAG TPA: hypothetical protein VH092_14490 [Urbifossiella sp.]|nr:hypothetical protein [Urbifossiella sp.]